MRINLDVTARGTAILTGEALAKKRKVESTWRDFCVQNSFNEIELPSIELSRLYKEKFVGLETQMYEFPDRKGRLLCLRPEGTATCQELARTIWKAERDVKIFYNTRCWRYEKPQAGRYREFSQFGVEVLNPTKDHCNYLIGVAVDMIKAVTLAEIEIDTKAQRGLGYYTENGFEIKIPSLGTQKQVVGGGAYKEGIGFAIGLDRILEALEI